MGSVSSHRFSNYANDAAIMCFQARGAANVHQRRVTMDDSQRVMTLKEAVDKVASESGITRREAYFMLMEAWRKGTLKPVSMEDETTPVEYPPSLNN